MNKFLIQCCTDPISMDWNGRDGYWEYKKSYYMEVLQTRRAEPTPQYAWLFKYYASWRDYYGKFDVKEVETDKEGIQ